MRYNYYADSTYVYMVIRSEKNWVNCVSTCNPEDKTEIILFFTKEKVDYTPTLHLKTGTILSRAQDVKKK